MFQPTYYQKEEERPSKVMLALAVFTGLFFAAIVFIAFEYFFGATPQPVARPVPYLIPVTPTPTADPTPTLFKVRVAT